MTTQEQAFDIAMIYMFTDQDYYNKIENAVKEQIVKKKYA